MIIILLYVIYSLGLVRYYFFKLLSSLHFTETPKHKNFKILSNNSLKNVKYSNHFQCLIIL